MIVDFAAIGQLVQDIGFPAVVALWLMWRYEKRLDNQGRQLAQLFLVVTVLAQAWDVEVPAAPEEES